ncbi:hypothetical protein D3C74_219140 [compost metagenome]
MKKVHMIESIAMGPLGGTGKFTYFINSEASLVKAAQEMGKNPVFQKEANELIAKFLKGNFNHGIGTKNLTRDINLNFESP